jgi:hypothetical protein
MKCPTLSKPSHVRRLMVDGLETEILKPFSQKGIKVFFDHF